MVKFYNSDRTVSKEIPFNAKTYCMISQDLNLIIIMIRIPIDKTNSLEAI